MTDNIFVLRDSRSDTGSNITVWNAGGGYTTNLTEANHFTKESAVRQHESRDSDIPLALDDLLALSRSRVDHQYLPEPSTKGEEFIVQCKSDYDGNDIKLVTESGYTFDYDHAKVFGRSEAIELSAMNEGYVCYNKTEIDPLVRRSTTLTEKQQADMLKKHGIKLHVPKPPPKERYRCDECGKFIKMTDFYSSCTHCGAQNY